ELRHLQDKALQFANRARVERLVAERAAGRLTAEQFRSEADAVLSNARVSTSGILALWVEDNSGAVIASSGPENLVVDDHGAKLPAEKTDDIMVVPPARPGGSTGLVFSSLLRGGEGQSLGTVSVLADFAPIASLLLDPRGLEDTGEVLVGVKQ